LLCIVRVKKGEKEHIQQTQKKLFRSHILTHARTDAKSELIGEDERERERKRKRESVCVCVCVEGLQTVISRKDTSTLVD